MHKDGAHCCDTAHQHHEKNHCGGAHHCKMHHCKMHNHWYMSRFTAILLVPLGLWFMCQMIKWSHLGGDLAGLKQLLSCSSCVVGIAAFITVLAYHSYLGMLDVIEDYIHHKCFKGFCIFWLKFWMVLSVIVGIVSVIMLRGA